MTTAPLARRLLAELLGAPRSLPLVIAQQP
jgi:hypothetical protein